MFLGKQVNQFARWVSGSAQSHDRKVDCGVRPAARRPQVSKAERQQPLRTAMLELMEPRCLMAADLIQIGAVYIEEDLGSDLHGDSFYISFQGGAENTQLQRLVIDGDLNTPGFSLGDLFFDTKETGLGADHAFDFHIEKLETANPNATVTANVIDGSTRLELNFTNFVAGDLLIFSIDVDEVQFLPPGETDTSILNDGFDPITSGVEFQNSSLQAEFIAPHYEDVSGQDKFINRYDPVLGPTGLPLPADDAGGKRDRSAGGAFSLQQTPKPISLSGVVYQDLNEDLQLQSTEKRLAGVTLELFVQTSTGYVSTGHQATTNAQGEYTFGTQLGLQPGTYQVREAQPAGFYSVGATPGQLSSGGIVGETVSGNQDILTEINIPLGDVHATELNFAENLPSSISGHVCVVTSGFDCFTDSSEKAPLADVEIQISDQAGNVLSTTTTDANGFYEFVGLRAGSYTLTQITPAGLIDGSARVGSEGGVVDGSSRITQIIVGGEIEAINYDFCELTPAQISGRTFYDQNNNGRFDTAEQPLAGVAVTLWDDAGNQVATTATDAQGRYEFTNLVPGVYRVTEVTPLGYVPGQADVGTVAGTRIGNKDATGDVISEIALTAGAQGINYDFGELLTGSIAGRVISDFNGNCILDVAGEMPLPGVRIELLDASGNVLQTTFTDSDGNYKFDDLLPDTYAIRESQPAGFFQGGQSAGSGGGNDSVTDLISLVNLNPGTSLVDYNFCEIPPGSLAGFIFSDTDGDCLFDANEQPIGGVTVELLDASGNVVQTTQTNSQGLYQFSNLRQGEYSVRELQPAGFLQGGQMAGSGGGDDSVADLISKINLGAGVDLVNYNFCEQLPGSISGIVFSDIDFDCILDPGETTLSGVRVDLLDSNGTLISTTLTDANGSYSFGNLAPGEYSVREHQPDGFFHGGQMAGSGGGDDSVADLISSIDLGAGVDLVNYNFCEQLPGSISGIVFADIDFDCILDAGETTLSGVRVDLLDSNGTLVATTLTDANGSYSFDNLAAGEYAVREHQPDGFFHGGQMAPASGGDDSTADLISGILLSPGQSVSEANFCEIPPAEISGYVFQDGPVIETATGEVPEDRRTVWDGLRTSDDTPIAGVTVQLRLVTGALAPSAQLALPGFYSGSTLEVQTDANGFYSFKGLRPAAFVVSQVQPTDFIDSLDTAGSTGGLTLNSQAEIDQFFNAAPNSGLRQLADSELMDAVIGLTLTPGQASVENNFSEVLVREKPILPPPPPPPPPPPLETPLVTPPLYTGLSPLTNPVALYSPPPIVLGAGYGTPPTWHLSVINGGTPRGSRAGDPIDDTTVALQTNRLDLGTWEVDGMGRDASWQTISTGQTPRSHHAIFDIPGATPLAGDFNGDGFDEIALFLDGEWFIDANGNGHWDEMDIWLKLGAAGDQPVVGDWDNDGKDDVGIFGRQWAGDSRALAHEPGLPDPENAARGRFKNVPPLPEHATDEPRLMKSRRDGQARADVIDHVFRFGGEDDVAISGDFNGDGIDSIGVYRGGKWILDVNGDGKINAKDDREIEFGAPGDVPLVGDFDNDGFDELAVQRGSQVIVDSNGNGRIDATDQVFDLQSSDGSVIVGDFDGDGSDEPALHHSAEQQRILSARAG